MFLGLPKEVNNKYDEMLRTDTEEEVTYDSFGNELIYTDENGLVSQTSYNQETEEETGERG